MNNLMIISSISAGAVLSLVYCFNCYMYRKKVNASVIINIFLLAGAIIYGFVLIVCPVFNNLKKLIANEVDLYLVISGTTIVVVSFQALSEQMFHSGNKSTRKTLKWD